MLRSTFYILLALTLFAFAFGPSLVNAKETVDDGILVAQATTGIEDDDEILEEEPNAASDEDDTDEATEEGEAEDSDEDVVEEEDVAEEDEDLDEEEEEFVEEPEVIVDDVLDDIIPEDQPIIGPKKITIDMVVYVDYQFFESSDAFKVKYHINMGGNANLSTALIKGTAEIATEVTGYLAKWPQGQCILNVSIAKVPYEITYQQTGEDEADLNILFKKDITESWTSTCTFIGATATQPFKTQGPPEQWIAGALERASPPISSIVAPVGEGETTSTTFDIPEYTVVEEGLGTATVNGTGIVSIEPKKGSKPKAGQSSSLRRGHPLPSRTPRQPALPMPPQTKPGHDLARRQRR